MSNPLEILTTLDQHLHSPAELTLFGRAALVLGYADPPPEYEATRDVDAIIPLAEGEPGEDFWLAQQATNEALKHRGLYITHLFSELDVILRPDWQAHRVPLSCRLARLRLFHPATPDLILTKMARADEQDLVDIHFLLRRDRLKPDQLRDLFQRARVPAIPEIQELFRTAQSKVLALAETNQRL